ncbi:MAG: hypothetical protein L6282_09175 [Candidatus Methanoperedenaceae archaeon]|nr:hypothetical protein [Candidatus Methanoperedenaceae archaeon]
MGSEENEPQIMAPRVTPLESVSTYALRGIRVRGVENPQGFGIDERRFVASNPSLLIGLWVLAPYLFLSLSCVVASPTYRRVGFYGFGVIIIEDRQCNSFSKTIAFNLRLSAFICG